MTRGEIGYVLGVDGGGTKTLALLADVDGHVLGRGVSGPSNHNVVGFEAACSTLETAITMARENYSGEISALCLGLAGLGRKEVMEQFKNWADQRFPKALVKVASDAEVLMMAGSSSGPALALICGTGSIVYGRTIQGELVRAGGWGYLFGDEGSGYAIGIEALRAAMQAYDGRAPKTLLTELILDRYRLHTPPELVRLIQKSESSHTELAALAELVEKAAGQDDAVAIAILEGSARELARALAAVYPKLGGSAVPLVITGGAILNGTFLQNAVRQACEAHGLAFTAIHYVMEPAACALQLALDLLPKQR